MNEADAKYLRRSFEVARRAVERGNAPFGAVLVSAQGEVLLEDENTAVTERDCTGHAEINLIRKASPRVAPDVLARATLYASCEPCAMCMGAIYWAGVGRLVFGLRTERLYALLGVDPNDPPLMLPCRTVLPREQNRLVVVGPELEEEAARVVV